MEKQSKGEMVELRLRHNHPNKKMRLGRHVIGIDFKKCDLNEDELKELKNPGPQYWFISKKEDEAIKAEALKKKAARKPKS